MEELGKSFNVATQGAFPHNFYLKRVGARSVKVEKKMPPVLTDRHGFILNAGNTVEKIADGSQFVVSKVATVGTSPVAYLLQDGNGGVVDASLVMLTDEEKDITGWKRATFCQVCFNHYQVGVTWFGSSFHHPTEGRSVDSACDYCLTNVDRSALPEVEWKV